MLALENAEALASETIQLDCISNYSQKCHLMARTANGQYCVLTVEKLENKKDKFYK